MAIFHLHITNTIGALGEEIAANLLTQKGLHITERNWKLNHLELDLIAENKHDIIFAEVKTRTSTFGHLPEEWVDRNKEHNMIVAANSYIKLHPTNKTPRFDIIGILLDPKDHSIIELKHIENAFLPNYKTNYSSACWTKR